MSKVSSKIRLVEQHSKDRIRKVRGTEWYRHSLIEGEYGLGELLNKLEDKYGNEYRMLMSEKLGYEA